jgi:hypothetical protein
MPILADVLAHMCVFLRSKVVPRETGLPGGDACGSEVVASRVRLLEVGV